MLLPSLKSEAGSADLKQGALSLCSFNSCQGVEPVPIEILTYKCFCDIIIDAISHFGSYLKVDYSHSKSV